ncbi:MAG TPA: hypothetical protein VG929_10125 [Actinomycetota bacterium]|nr:hypothetical protein [Actinomycetota bacterium]
MATTRDDVGRTGVTATQVALLLVGMLAILGILWFLFLRGGDEPAPVTAPPVTTPSVVPEPEETADPDAKTPKAPLETFEVFAPKDPFRPLISQAAAAPGGTAVGAAPAPGATAAPGVGQPSGGSDISGDGTGTTGGGGGNGSSDSVGGHRVRLIDTFRRGGEPAARVQVDGTVYTVREGDRFAENFELLSVSGDCASMLYGDDEFSLCEGEEILK